MNMSFIRIYLHLKFLFFSQEVSIENLTNSYVATALENFQNENFKIVRKFKKIHVYSDKLTNFFM